MFARPTNANRGLRKRLLIVAVHLRIPGMKRNPALGLYEARRKIDIGQTREACAPLPLYRSADAARRPAEFQLSLFPIHKPRFNQHGRYTDKAPS
jgi:hypothetical protein